jgi:hypothetical protein
MAIGGSITSATEGSVLFAGASGVLAQDNANFFWDDSSNRLGIGTTSPDSTLEVEQTGALTADMVRFVSSGATVTNNADALSILFTQGDDSDGGETNTGINLTVTGNSIGDTDTLNGISINNLAGAGDASPITRALSIGNNWDANIFFADIGTQIQINDTGVITFEDSLENDMFVIQDVGNAANHTLTLDADTAFDLTSATAGDAILNLIADTDNTMKQIHQESTSSKTVEATLDLSEVKATAALHQPELLATPFW